MKWSEFSASPFSTRNFSSVCPCVYIYIYIYIYERFLFLILSYLNIAFSTRVMWLQQLWNVVIYLINVPQFAYSVCILSHLDELIYSKGNSIVRYQFKCLLRRFVAHSTRLNELIYSKGNPIVCCRFKCLLRRFVAISARAQSHVVLLLNS